MSHSHAKIQNLLYRAKRTILNEIGSIQVSGDAPNIHLG